jgi:hypothetical protein
MLWSRERFSLPLLRCFISLAALAASVASSAPCLAWEPAIAAQSGALAGNRHRVVVSTDIGGTDPDDFQSHDPQQSAPPRREDRGHHGRPAAARRRGASVDEATQLVDRPPTDSLRRISLRGSVPDLALNNARSGRCEASSGWRPLRILQ